MTKRPDNQRVLIFGAGAVGSLLGGLLADAGNQVTLLGRGRHIEQVRRDGLRGTTQSGTFHVNPLVVNAPSDVLKPPDLLFVTVRSFGVGDALPSIRSLIGDQTVLVTVQNGIGTDEAVAAELSGVPLVVGSLTLSASVDAPGSVSSTSVTGGIALAPLSSAAPVQRVARTLRAAGIEVQVTEDYRSMKWSKLLLNQMANGVPAVLDWTPEQVYSDSIAFRCEQALLRETLRVIREEGCELTSLPGFPVPLLRWAVGAPPWLARGLLKSRVSRGRGEKLPSLLLDIRAERQRTEARWLYGSVDDEAGKLNSEAPLNKRMHHLLEGVAVNRALREMFRGRPDRLARNLGLAGRR